MKIDYKILWIEDKIASKPFQSLINEVRKFLTDQFFEVHIETAEDYDEFKEKFEVHDNFDLIITDLNLNESHGSQVIDFIRDVRHIHTEIFFYSANEDFKKTHLINSNRITFYQLNGQDYHKELNSSIVELINLTISKFQNIITMRGMIMHETSLLDIQMKEIAIKFLNEGSVKIEEIVKKSREEEKDFFGVEEVRRLMFDSISKNANEKFERAKSEKLKDILKDDLLFNASQRNYVIGLILKALEEVDFTEDYKNQIIWYRNQFAHAKLHRKADGQEYFIIKKAGTETDVVFDDALCKEIRNNIIRHKRNLDKLSIMLFN